MAQPIVINAEAINDTAQSINALHGQITQGTTVLRGKLNALSSEWKGSAAAQFAQVMHDYDVAQKKLGDALQELGRLTREAGVRYTEHEEATRRMFGH